MKWNPKNLDRNYVLRAPVFIKIIIKEKKILKYVELNDLLCN